MNCQLCEKEEIKWAVIVPYWEYAVPRYIEIKEGDDYKPPYWLICNTCKETGKVDERRKLMYNNEAEYTISAL